MQDCLFSSLVLSELQTVFDRIRSSSTTTPCPSKIDPKSLSTFLRSMQYKPKSGEVQEAIWEIDEDHDGKLSWEEFHRACERCISDSQAREPQQVYNYILFVIFSRSSNVLVESELRRLLHLRYGKVRLDSPRQHHLEMCTNSHAPCDVGPGSLCIDQGIRTRALRYLSRGVYPRNEQNPSLNITSLAWISKL